MRLCSKQILNQNYDPYFNNVQLQLAYYFFFMNMSDVLINSELESFLFTLINACQNYTVNYHFPSYDLSLKISFLFLFFFNLKSNNFSVKTLRNFSVIFVHICKISFCSLKNLIDLNCFWDMYGISYQCSFYHMLIKPNISLELKITS